ncbi:group II intron maturase-specific domain-containing protein [Catellatospora methionotrophica]|uniref:group II intron maturase-specific domain-containing protein n=1 Tax=Catellatospora methionotrophica TaxID=121620 RepID=UPI0033C68398
MRSAQPGEQLRQGRHPQPAAGLRQPRLRRRRTTLRDHPHRPGPRLPRLAHPTSPQARHTNRQYVYTYPSRKAIKAVTAKVKTICRRNVNQPLPTLIRQLNPALRAWGADFRPEVSAAAFADLAVLPTDVGNAILK